MPSLLGCQVTQFLSSGGNSPGIDESLSRSEVTCSWHIFCFLPSTPSASDFSFLASFSNFYASPQRPTPLPPLVVTHSYWLALEPLGRNRRGTGCIGGGCTPGSPTVPQKAGANFPFSCFVPFLTPPKTYIYTYPSSDPQAAPCPGTLKPGGL